MFVSKIEVLIAHDNPIDASRLEEVIETALAEELDRRQAFFEVRDGGQHEVTLGSIVYSLEEGEVLLPATRSEEKEPVGA